MPHPYDEVAYRGDPHAQTHPDRLAAIAWLMGLPAAPPQRCGVLEIGCGDGGNLVPMAYTLPGSRFVGIDSAPGAVERGRELAAAAGISNVALEVLDLAAAGPEIGEFDYIVAHGVYSWIPAELRERLLWLCAAALAPHGVVYISYNALPGGRLRQAMRDMLRFHVRNLENPDERIEQARAMAEFLAGVAGFEAEIESVRGAPGWMIYHDLLAQTNDAFYFHEFAQQAAAHGLEFLAEADFFEMSYAHLPESARETLAEMERQDVLLKEQYLDFLKRRRFRQTLLCHARPAARGPASAAEMWVASESVPELSARWPSYARAADCGLSLDALLQLHASGAVELHAAPPAFVTEVSARPRMSAVARAQACRGTVVANLRHQAVDLENQDAARMVALLDGSRDGEALATRAVLERLAALALLEA
jgi:SAM-dependent methyltransferase